MRKINKSIHSLFAFSIVLCCLIFSVKAEVKPFEIKDTQFIYSASYQGMNIGKIHIAFEKKSQLEVNQFPFSTEGIENFYYYSLNFYPEGIADLFVDFWQSEHWLGLYQQKLVNLSYFSQYQGFFKERKIDVLSNLANETNLNQDSNQVFEAPFPNLNNFTVFLGLAFDLLKNPKRDENQTLVYHTSRDDESRKREFVYRNQSTVQTQAGEYQVDVFELNETRYQTKLLVAEAFSYLPVKIFSKGSRGSIEIELFEVVN